MKAIKTIFLGATNNLSNRVKATDTYGNQITIDWDSELDAEHNHINAAESLADKMNWKGKLVMGSLKDCYVHVFVGGK
jgi:RNA binding exosome subunit